MREMKDSGIEWIGEIPADWEVSTIKREYVFQTGWTPDTTHEEYFIGENIWINISDMKSKVVYDSEKHISDEAVQLASMNISPKGSLLYAFKLSVGAVSFCGMDMYTNEAIATFLPGKNNLRFLYYTAPIFIIKNANENIYGAKLLNQKLIRNAEIVIPPLEVQKRIADYLDHKCGQIDAIIARQQEVIEKLKAYKLSVITEAVTKGLNPDVPMKNSGVEWIGEIPQFTTVTCARHLYEIILGKMLSPVPKNEEDTLESYFCAANIHFSDIDYDNLKTMWFSKEERRNYLVSLGDLLIVEGGAGAGGAHIVEKSVENCYIQNSIMIARSKSSVSNKWLYYTLYSLVNREYIDFVCNKATIPHFTKDKLGNTPVVFFPREIEKSIIVFLDKKCSNIDKLIFQKKRVIEQLTAYKKSLIYEVVTGKKEV